MVCTIGSLGPHPRLDMFGLSSSVLRRKTREVERVRFRYLRGRPRDDLTFPASEFSLPGHKRIIIHGNPKE